MAAHSMFSPSAAHRWLNCTASAMLEAREPEQSSPYADEGSLAHAMCARGLLTLLGEDTTAADEDIARYGQYRTEEMEEYTDAYVALVWDKFQQARTKTRDARLLIETRLDLSDHVSECFGTADAIIIADKCIEVIDFKYGKGVKVSAERNPQMMLYALGALDLFGLEYNTEWVRLSVVQPRIGNLSEWLTGAASIDAWAEWVLVPAAQKALNGGWQTPGEWCRFCKVAAVCSTLARYSANLNGAEYHTMTDSEIARLLPMLPVVKSWVSSVEDHTLRKALEGTKFPGYKVVEGRSVRRIVDAEAVAGALEAGGYDRAAFMRPPELRTLTDIERTIGRAKFSELCERWIEKPAGKPTLVPESDKRPALGAGMFDGIEDF